MPTDLIESAHAYHASGHFTEAIETCRQILKRDPENAEVLHLCGLACRDGGFPLDAVPLLAQATQARPDQAAWRFDYGLALQAVGRTNEAATAYRDSLAALPNNPDGWCRLAAVLRKTQAWAEASAAYERALAQSTSEEALFGLGCVMVELQRWAEAAEKFQQTLAIQPRHAEALNGLGLSLKGAKKFADAETAFRRALDLRPRYLEALFNLGKTLQSLEKGAEAVTVYQQALNLAPRSPEILSSLGNALWSAQDFAGALTAHQLALKLKPKQPASYNNLGNALLGLRRFSEATAAYEHSLALQPGNAITLSHLGNVHFAQNQLTAALSFYQRALAVNPEFKEAIFNQSLVHLLRGDFKAGLPGYEMRWILKRRDAPDPMPAGQWLGDSSLEGKTLLVCCEQGFGDTIQFVRYLPLLQARGAKILLRVQQALRELLAAMPGVTLVTDKDETLPPFDFYCLLLSLPLALGTEQSTIPANIPYLDSSREKAARWRNRFAGFSGKKIGIVCSGNATHRNDYNRSIPLAEFKPLAAASGGKLWLLQNELRRDAELTLISSPEIVSLASELADFSDTAAVIASLDLVITIDSVLAHLAGAMGKPVWTLLPFAPDWRWMMDRPDSPWYPTMRLFRQPEPGNWKPVLALAARELAGFCEKR